MSLPKDIEDLVRDRTHKDAEPVLRTFLAETLERQGVRYDLYFARSAQPTGIRVFVRTEKLMNVFPGNSIQVTHGGDAPKAPSSAFSVGPEYISLKVRIIQAWIRELERLRDAAYERIAGGSTKGA